MEEPPPPMFVVVLLAFCAKTEPAPKTSDRTSALANTSFFIVFMVLL